MGTDGRGRRFPESKTPRASRRQTYRRGRGRGGPRRPLLMKAQCIMLTLACTGASAKPQPKGLMDHARSRSLLHSARRSSRALCYVRQVRCRQGISTPLYVHDQNSKVTNRVEGGGPGLGVWRKRGDASQRAQASSYRMNMFRESNVSWHPHYCLTYSKLFRV